MTKKPTINLNTLKAKEFERAKYWWSTSNIASLGIVALGLLANIIPSSAASAAIISTILIIFMAFAGWKSDNAKDNGEWILRQFEMFDGIGWPVDKKTVLDLLISTYDKSKFDLEEDSIFKYFDSKREISPKRLIENIMESAFFSKHQSFYIAKWILGVSCLIILLALFSAAIALQSDISHSNSLFYLLLTAIQGLVATGLLRLTIDYWSFGSAADQIVNRAEELLKRRSRTEIEAIKLAHDYQIKRSKSPLIPSWVWKLREKNMNKLWKRHH